MEQIDIADLNFDCERALLDRHTVIGSETARRGVTCVYHLRPNTAILNVPALAAGRAPGFVREHFPGLKVDHTDFVLVF